MFARSLGGVNELFAPPGNDWQPVSPALARLRRTVLVASAALLVVAAGVLDVMLSLPGWLWAATGVVVLGLAGFGWVVIGRNARWWGYAEREEDLYIKHGALFRTLVVVPYGRMQYVDVQAGPLEQAFKVASVHLHTASPGTSARIPGLPAAEAARLRDRLTELGESQAAGL
jgi:membrane protein YdbS with pleckstrin-like domain